MMSAPSRTSFASLGRWFHREAARFFSAWLIKFRIGLSRRCLLEAKLAQPRGHRIACLASRGEMLRVNL
jgi:hypothetical protein